jgi:ankyrin repeat protein
MKTDPLWYELRNLVYSKEFISAERLIAENSDLLDRTDGMGETVLHFLAVENDIEGVAWLYSCGASIDTKNRFGTPMVFEVAELGHKDLLHWLAQNGADLSVVDREGRSVLEYLRRGLDKMNPALPTFERMEKRRRRYEEMARFVAENLPGVSEDGEPKK